MKITTIQVALEHEGRNYLAVFRNDRKGGVIRDYKTENEACYLMNANPQEVLSYLAGELGIDVTNLKLVAKAAMNVEKSGPTCTACHTNWVDVNEGYDTCSECLKKM